jgi:hypothetical protein
MTPSTPSLAAARVLPLTPRPHIVRRSSWPFPVEQERDGREDLRVHAARIIATTAEHWKVRR